MVERIKKLMDTKKLSATEFSEQIGIQRSSLSHVLSGRNNPSLDFMLKIKNSFPEVNLNWLLLGDENMFEKTEELKSVVDESETEVLKPIQQKDLITPVKGAENTKEMDAGVEGLSERQEKEFTTRIQGEKAIKRVILIYNDDTFSSYQAE